jgi:3-oxoacyl-[acyl-carrier protein] reductase
MGSIEAPRGDYGSLNGKVALVTGSGRGIGRGIALGLAQRGASVVINYANASKGAEEVVMQIGKLGSKAFAIKADVTKVAEVERLFKEAIDHVRTAFLPGHTPLTLRRGEIVVSY